LVNVLSKKLLINSSIEDHINRRLARIIQSQHYSSNYNKQAQTGINNKQTTSRKHISSCGELASEPLDTDSNDEVSDEGLDISQRIGDNLNTIETDDNLIGMLLF
jgi:hypothetical protein